MDRHITYSIDEINSGISIKEFLKMKKYASQTISDLKHIKDGIMHNGKRAYVTEILEAGDTVAINIYEDSSSEKIPPIEMELDILYEDDDLIIVNKPADMPVHPSLNNYENTLANGLAFYYESMGEKFVFRCLNRLDRNTTGTVLVAKNPISGAMLSEMIRDRQIDKEYVAIVEGNVRDTLLKHARAELRGLKKTGENSFTIDAPIARVSGSTIERCVDFENGERAVTHAKIIGNVTDRGCSVVSCNLETGRTHQIRVHMSYAGHPLVGDGMYNPGLKTSNNMENSIQQKGPGRQMLHCRSLSFIQPVTGEIIYIEAPYPEDFYSFGDQ